MSTVLLVDSDPLRCGRAEEVLQRAGHVVWSAGTPGQALRLLDRGRFDVVLAAFDLGSMTGVRLLEIAAGIAPRPVRLLRAGSHQLGQAIEAVERGIVARFVPDPCDAHLLREAIGWADDEAGPPSLELRLIA